MNPVNWIASLIPQESAAEVTVSRRAMACEFSVTLPGETPGAVDAACAALDEVERQEERLSVYLPDSDISRLNRAGEAILDSEVYRLLRLSSRVAAVTDGAFDAAAGALVKAWGFYQGPKRVPTPSARRAALAITGFRNVAFDDTTHTVRVTRPGVEFNLGGIGKGYAIDRALRRMGAGYTISAALIQGGQSSLRGAGVPSREPRGWLVAVGNPCYARLWLRDRALGTSGGENQFFVSGGRRYGHVLDPRTGWPAAAVLSASAVANTAAEADALSTAFFVAGLEATRTFCQKHPDIGAVILDRGGKVHIFGKVML